MILNSINWYEHYKIIEAQSNYKQTDISLVSKRRELCYYDIGHGSQDRPLLWVISDDGDFHTEQGDTGDVLRHYNSFDDVDIAYQGRVIKDKKLGKISSATMNDDENIKKNFAEEILRQNLGGSIRLYWF